MATDGASMVKQHIQGRAWVFGNDINTDVIHAPDYFSLDDERVKLGLFRRLDPTIQQRMRPGDVIVGGANFGCGSSRETVIRSLKLNGIGAIIALDFARIFFRSATNLGLPCLTFANGADVAAIKPGDLVEVRLDKWTLRPGNGDPIALVPPGFFIENIWRSGGLLSLLDD